MGHSKHSLIRWVKQGECRLNSLDLVHRGPGFIHLRGDMEAKYAEVHGYSGNEFWIGAGERTLHKRKLDPETMPPNGWAVVRLNLPSDGWIMEATISRYTLDVFAYTMKRGRQIWTDANATFRRKRR